MTKIAYEKSYHIDEQAQIRQNKLAMTGCLAQYAKPELINQENELMDKALNEELMEKYFVN